MTTAERITELEAQLPGLHEHIQDLQSQLEGSDTRVNSFKDECNELRTQLAAAQKELAQFHATMEGEKKPDWEKWLKDLAAKLEFLCWKSVKDPLTLEEGRALLDAARQLRYMADGFTLKANFVPSNLRIKELEAACAAKDEALRGALKTVDDYTGYAWREDSLRAQWQKALALTCGEGWKSPEDVAGIEGQRTYFLQDNQRLKAELERVCDKLVKLEAEAAQLRETLSYLNERQKIGYLGFCGFHTLYQNKIDSALATTAGQSLLDELERYKKALEKLWKDINSPLALEIVRQALQQKGEK